MTADELKQARLSLGLNQERFARVTKSSRASINRWENDKFPVPRWMEYEIERLKNERKDT